MKYSRFKILSAWCFILSLVFAFTGCSSFYRLAGPAEQPYNPGVSKSLSTIGTVCLVELHNNTAYPQISGDVTQSLYQMLQKKHLFDLKIMRQTDPDWKNLPIQPDSPYTLEQLLIARKMLGVDAILTGTVTSYTPYPHMMLGLQLKVIDLRDGQTVWAIEQIWDTADKATEERIKKYFQRELRKDYSPLGEQLAVLSSINFIRFVTYDAIELLYPGGN